MSYNDDDELKVGDLQNDEEDLDLEPDVEVPIDDDLISEDDEIESSEEFVGLDGAEY